MAGGRDLSLLVRRVRDETPDIRSFVLESPSGEPLPEYKPGAHVDVEPVPGMIRQYSLAGDATDRNRYLLGVKRDVASRGGSSAMHSLIREGATLRISQPKNNFTLTDTEGRRLLLAGGIGITPLLSMAAALHGQDAPFELHYFIRSNDDLAFKSLLAEAPWAAKVSIHLGLVPPALNDFLDVLLDRPNPNDQIYMCGPGPFMDVICDTAVTAGWNSASVFYELFSAAPPEVPLDGADFIVRLNSTGEEFVVSPEQSIVDVLRDGGHEIETSCEQGICGTCVTRCLEGDPDHHDMYLSDQEHDEERLFTPCVSRAKTKYLVIDR